LGAAGSQRSDPRIAPRADHDGFQAPGFEIHLHRSHRWTKRSPRSAAAGRRSTCPPPVARPQVIDAVNKGTLDGAHGIPAFWFGKNTAFGLYGAGPDFGMDANQLLGWVEYGGGKELYAEIQAAAQLDIVSFLFGPVPCEPFGWFKKEIRGLKDLKGFKNEPQARRSAITRGSE
jgi:hypothetical protein